MTRTNDVVLWWPSILAGIAILLFVLQAYRLHGMQILPHIVPEPGAERARDTTEFSMAVLYIAWGVLAALQFPWSCFLAWRRHDWRVLRAGLWRSAILVFGWLLIIPAGF